MLLEKANFFSPSVFYPNLYDGLET